MFIVFALSAVFREVSADEVQVTAKKLNENFFSYFTEMRADSSEAGKSGASTQGSRTVDPSKVDLVFLMDSSGSIGSDNFVKQKEFVSNMIDHSLTVTCNRSTRIALISFADISQITIEFDFDDHSTSATPRADLKDAVNSIAYINGDATNTAGALTEAHFLFNDVSRGGRSDATRLVFVITDGRSNQGLPPGPEADILRQMDEAVIFVMGVANFESVNSQVELRAIASDPENDEGRVLVVDDFDDMTAIAARFGAQPRCDLIDLATNRPEDWNSILVGFRILKQNGVINNLAALHSQAFTIFGSAHSGAGFLPWHRAYLSMLEYALQIARNDTSLRLPYWNWAGEHVLTSAIWEHLGGSVNNGDPIDNCVVTGPFRQDLWHPDRSECVIRNIYPTTVSVASQADLDNDRTFNPIYEFFRQQTEAGGNRHNSVHVRFGFPSDMRSAVSPRDPIFYFVRT
jgi:hypothetical protein